MLKTIFTMILAGCGDGGSACEVLDRVEVEAVDLAGCEAVLDARLAQMTDAWPEYAGYCAPLDSHASLPEGWIVQPVIMAENRYR